MTFEMGALISFVLAIVGGAVGYGRLNRSTEANSEQIDEIWKVVTKTRDWQVDHEKDSAGYRIELEKEMGRIRENIGKWDAKLDNIINQLSYIKEAIKEWKESNGR